MDPVRNPYTPGAGTPPVELAGRSEWIEAARIAIERTRTGRSAKSLILVGLRGVGKTVLLERIRANAIANNALTLRIEASENRSLPAMLVPQLRIAILSLSRSDQARELAATAMRALAGFVSAMKVTFNDIEFGVNIGAKEPGLADNGDLEADLQILLLAAGQAAAAAERALVLFIDELQYVKEPQLAALITALHRCNQEKVPVMMMAAGLPQLLAQTGNAKSYAERLFDFPEIGPLSVQAAKDAITIPAAREDVAFTEDAIQLILEKTERYPYFLQEWGKHAWDSAMQSPITSQEVNSATETAITALDASFFRMRLDRLTPSEKSYIRAMAEMGEGPHRSGDVARLLNKTVNATAPVRASLIKKGMVWSPNHGETAFTVPLFHEFMVRVMPIES